MSAVLTQPEIRKCAWLALFVAAGTSIGDQLFPHWHGPAGETLTQFITRFLESFFGAFFAFLCIAAWRSWRNHKKPQSGRPG
jgi:hypothetical protein